MNTKETHVLITGATKGIGHELAKIFAKDGYNLVLTSRDKTELDGIAAELRREHQIQIATIAKDLFDPENAFQLYDEIKAKGIEIGILVNNAGHGHYGEFIE